MTVDATKQKRKQEMERTVKSSKGIALALLLLGVMGCQRTLMPTPNIYLCDVNAPFAEINKSFQNNYVDVVYATDRASEYDKRGNVVYTSKRSKSLAYGTCRVEFGKNISWEELVQDSYTDKRKHSLSLSLTQVQEMGQTPDIPLRLVKQDGEIIYDPSEFRQMQEEVAKIQDVIRHRLSMTSRKHVYIYIHGYNSTFEDAAFVMAELWHFLGREGVPLVFTWPAGHGGLLGYFYDRESGEFAILHLRKLIERIAEIEDLEQIHIIAHSRGADVAVTALRELYLPIVGCDGDPKSLKIQNLILAAPDMDMEVIQQRIVAEELFRLPNRVTVYTSLHDRAIGLSSWLFDSVQRAGQVIPNMLSLKQKERLEVLSTVDVVEAKVKTDFLGHGYFHSNPAVSSDLILALQNKVPGPENARPLKSVIEGFWQITDDYPMCNNSLK